MHRSKSIALNCFSPPVMVTTMIIESSLAIYTVWRYKMTMVTRLITLMLVSLATFQLAEYCVCTGLGGIHAQDWSRLGFVAIAALPPLGLHILHQLADKPGRRWLSLNYAMMAAFMVSFLAFPAAFNNYQCTGNYVIFHLRSSFASLYYVYYFGWLFTAMGLGMQWANEFRDKGKKGRKKLETIRAMITGYLVFLVPVTVANVVSPSTKAGIPSIMCGFAVILALILGFYVLPRAGQGKELTNPLNRLSLR